ncbi:hypothetical protein PPERSA_04534 [Pseudocohnilembus persalinus]|uniref:Uncharacterized protein n=1 Tax=Pseudocohnilembus persalinus TaxID=266149 RepID=A0A0V0QSZ8_PSEPJ|nr:hypothetical protein PPERSA_04534 [Pseudocohnilembus persalinus]|eukprot:KRX05497.1 hypothetical protein PPERSA_04534 [Pseudocohnilembus persalinus]
MSEENQDQNQKLKQEGFLTNLQNKLFGDENKRENQNKNNDEQKDQIQKLQELQEGQNEDEEEQKIENLEEIQKQKKKGYVQKGKLYYQKYKEQANESVKEINTFMKKKFNIQKKQDEKLIQEQRKDEFIKKIREEDDSLNQIHNFAFSNNQFGQKQEQQKQNLNQNLNQNQPINIENNNIAQNQSQNILIFKQNFSGISEVNSQFVEEQSLSKQNSFLYDQQRNNVQYRQNNQVQSMFKMNQNQNLNQNLGQNLGQQNNNNIYKKNRIFDDQPNNIKLTKSRNENRIQTREFDKILQFSKYLEQPEIQRKIDLQQGDSISHIVNESQFLRENQQIQNLNKRNQNQLYNQNENQSFNKSSQDFSRILTESTLMEDSRVVRQHGFDFYCQCENQEEIMDFELNQLFQHMRQFSSKQEQHEQMYMQIAKRCEELYEFQNEVGQMVQAKAYNNQNKIMKRNLMVSDLSVTNNVCLDKIQLIRGKIQKIRQKYVEKSRKIVKLKRKKEKLEAFLRFLVQFRGRFQYVFDANLINDFEKIRIFQQKNQQFLDILVRSNQKQMINDQKKFEQFNFKKQNEGGQKNEGNWGNYNEEQQIFLEYFQGNLDGKKVRNMVEYVKNAQKGFQKDQEYIKRFKILGKLQGNLDSKLKNIIKFIRFYFQNLCFLNEKEEQTVQIYNDFLLCQFELQESIKNVKEIWNEQEINVLSQAEFEFQQSLQLILKNQKKLQEQNNLQNYPSQKYSERKAKQAQGERENLVKFLKKMVEVENKGKIQLILFVFEKVSFFLENIEIFLERKKGGFQQKLDEIYRKEQSCSEFQNQVKIFWEERDEELKQVFRDLNNFLGIFYKVYLKKCRVSQEFEGLIVREKEKIEKNLKQIQVNYYDMFSQCVQKMLEKVLVRDEWNNLNSSNQYQKLFEYKQKQLIEKEKINQEHEYYNVSSANNNSNFVSQQQYESIKFYRQNVKSLQKNQIFKYLCLDIENSRKQNQDQNNYFNSQKFNINQEYQIDDFLIFQDDYKKLFAHDYYFDEKFGNKKADQPIEMEDDLESSFSGRFWENLVQNQLENGFLRTVYSLDRNNASILEFFKEKSELSREQIKVMEQKDFKEIKQFLDIYYNKKFQNQEFLKGFQNQNQQHIGLKEIMVSIDSLQFIFNCINQNQGLNSYLQNDSFQQQNSNKDSYFMEYSFNQPNQTQQQNNNNINNKNQQIQSNEILTHLIKNKYVQNSSQLLQEIRNLFLKVYVDNKIEDFSQSQGHLWGLKGVQFSDIGSIINNTQSDLEMEFQKMEFSMEKVGIFCGDLLEELGERLRGTGKIRKNLDFIVKNLISGIFFAFGRQIIGEIGRFSEGGRRKLIQVGKLFLEVVQGQVVERFWEGKEEGEIRGFFGDLSEQFSFYLEIWFGDGKQIGEYIRKLGGVKDFQGGYFRNQVDASLGSSAQSQQSKLFDSQNSNFTNNFGIQQYKQEVYKGSDIFDFKLMINLLNSNDKYKIDKDVIYLVQLGKYYYKYINQFYEQVKQA